MSDTLTFPLHLVLIDQGATVLATTVPEHEIALLKVVHGAENVKGQGPYDDDEIELSISAEAEWARLSRKYRRVNSPDMVPVAFRTGPSQLEAFGFSMEHAADAIAPEASHFKEKKVKPADKAKKAA